MWNNFLKLSALPVKSLTASQQLPYIHCVSQSLPHKEKSTGSLDEDVRGLVAASAYVPVVSCPAQAEYFCTVILAVS